MSRGAEYQPMGLNEGGAGWDNSGISVSVVSATRSLRWKMTLRPHLRRTRSLLSFVATISLVTALAPGVVAQGKQQRRQPIGAAPIAGNPSRSASD